MNWNFDDSFKSRNPALTLKLNGPLKSFGPWSGSHKFKNNTL